MRKKTIGRNGWYKVIHTKSGPKAMYKPLNKEEFILNKDNLSLREYINYTNLYDASGIVAFNLGEHRIVPSNIYHLRFLLYKVQLVLFGETCIDSLFCSPERLEQFQPNKNHLSGEKLAMMTLYKFEEAFKNGDILEECCNIGGKIELNNFQVLFWIYEMLLQKTKDKLEIPEKFNIESLNHKMFTQKYPQLKLMNVV